MIARFSSRIWKTCIMNGTASSSSNHSDTFSSSTEGANGRNDSRRLILALSSAFMSARRASQSIDRVEGRKPPHFSIGDRVHRAAPGQGKISQLRALLQNSKEVKESLLIHRLGRACDVTMTIL